ncbi:MAG: hypothetical protein WBA13_21830 [Microcoleaceae cyanobacterium]
MSKYQAKSESTRSRAARLRSLSQLRTLGPVGIVTLLGIFVWQLSEHPEWFQVNDPQPNSPNTVLSNQLSDEERSIAAEIDSSTFLLEELDTNAPQVNPFNDSILAGEALLESARPSRNNSDSAKSFNLLLPEFSTSDQSNSIPPKPNFNFFQNQQLSPNSSTFGNTSNLNITDNFNLNTGENQAVSSPNSDSNIAPQTPLGAAMEQYNPDSSATDSTDSELTQTTTSEDPNSAANTANYSDALPTYSDPSLLLNLGTNSTQALPSPTSSNLPQPSWIVPKNPTQNTPSAPTIAPIPIQNPYQTNLSIPRNLPLNPPTVPITPGYTNPDGQSPSRVYSNPAYGYNNSGSVQNYNYGVTQPNIQNTTVTPNPLVPRNSNNLNPATRPFSVPRPIPGRTIGGGRINTFANP